MNPKKVLFTLMLLALALGVTACIPEDSAPQRAWIDYPIEGEILAVGEPVSVFSHGYARDGLAEALLTINGEAYRRDSYPSSGTDFDQLYQEWRPEAPGMYTLQVTVYDVNGLASLPATVSVQVGETAVEVVEVIEELPPPTATFTPEISETPTNTPEIPHTPTFTPTNTPTLHPPTWTPTHTNTPVPADTAPPPVPAPVVPANNLELSCRASQTLAWTPVTDPSGIDGYFVELEKEVTTGNWQNAGEWGPISGKQIDVAVDCGLRYRWVVRARDGAGNFSDWSGISNFAILLD